MKLTSAQDGLLVPNLTLEQLEQTVRELAREYPDTVYQPKGDVGCCYLTGKAGPGNGCIIGQALRGLGCQFTMPIGCKVNSLFNETQHMYVCWVRAVQRYQDNGNSWAAAVTYADSLR